MSTKIKIGMAMAAAVLSGVLWLGSLAWRAHHDLVSLDMRNAPLAAVVRAIERQTWEKVVFDQKLNARITIKVRNAPLSRVLDLVAAKAGGRWQKIDAVYDSGEALGKLESAIRAGEKLDAAGWTNLAPDFSDAAFQGLPVSDMGGDPPQAGGPHVLRRIGPGGPPDGPRFRATGGGAGDNERMEAFLPDGTVDQWSAERLILESSLAPRLNGPSPAEATPEAATRTAEAVQGRARMFYALEKSPMPMGGPRHGPLAHTGGGPENIGDVGASISQERRQQRILDLSYSPEEQVEHARQAAHNKIEIQTMDDTQ